MRSGMTVQILGVNKAHQSCEAKMFIKYTSKSRRPLLDYALIRIPFFFCFFFVFFFFAFYVLFNMHLQPK